MYVINWPINRCVLLNIQNYKNSVYCSHQILLFKDHITEYYFTNFSLQTESSVLTVNLSDNIKRFLHSGPTTEKEIVWKIHTHIVLHSNAGFVRAKKLWVSEQTIFCWSKQQLFIEGMYWDCVVAWFAYFFWSIKAVKPTKL